MRASDEAEMGISVRGQALIVELFSGLQGNGSSEGRGCAAPRWEHENVASWWWVPGSGL